ncbi:MAG: GxxExxY protein [Chloroflexi bacterium]|nr:GxxExxY protein [Chloroflexota bacterium]MBI3742566.1 GxxExxY protein [Chloroflexota bacterium]
MPINQLTQEVIGAAIEVHKFLGPGLLESAYEECLCHELNLRKIRFERQLEMPVTFKGTRLNSGYRIDLLVDKLVVVEVKSVAELVPIHEAQILTYLRLSKCQVGLLFNFNVVVMKHGIKRVVLNFQE